MKIMHFAGGGDIGGAKTHILSLGQKLSAHNEFYLVSFRAGAFAEEAKALWEALGQYLESLKNPNCQ